MEATSVEKIPFPETADHGKNYERYLAYMAYVRQRFDALVREGKRGKDPIQEMGELSKGIPVASSTPLIAMGSDMDFFDKGQNPNGDELPSFRDR